MIVYVTYRQLAVFRSGLTNPFNDWTDAHVRQGFSWRPGSVSFRTFDDGALDVDVVVGASARRPDARRAILVPFTVAQDGHVEVATITESHPLQLDPGDYGLTFEHGTREGSMWCRLLWQPAKQPVRPAILLADEELAPHEPLLMKAESAKSG